MARKMEQQFVTTTKAFPHDINNNNGKSREHQLGLLGCYRKPAYLKSFVLDHLLQAAHYVQVPIWIEVSNITRSQPAIIHCVCILIIQVTCEEIIRQNPNANEQLKSYSILQIVIDVAP
jgi:hypothetical protein